MRVLITGITGFAGSHLADYILEAHPDVEIFGLRHCRSKLENIEHIEHRITLIEADLKDQSSISEAIQESKPSRIFHLAAHSYVPTSWIMPGEVLTNNIVGQINLLEAVRKIQPGARLHIAGSSEEYGLVGKNETPINEQVPLRPLSVYGVSKVAQDLLGYQYHKSYEMHIVRTRAFNHTGPRRGEMFVCSSFAKQIIELKHNDESAIKVGNLEAIRDFTDVRDIVRGYWLALAMGKAGEVYNIGSGIAITIQKVLDLLIKISGISIKVIIDEHRLRPSDVPILICDYRKFYNLTEWNPIISFKETLSDLLDYWDRKINVKEITNDNNKTSKREFEQREIKAQARDYEKR